MTIMIRPTIVTPGQQKKAHKLAEVTILHKNVQDIFVMVQIAIFSTGSLIFIDLIKTYKFNVTLSI